jgi:hypothetical protein
MTSGLNILVIGPIINEKSEGGTENLIQLEIPIIWDITTRSPLKVNRRFGGTLRNNLCENLRSYITQMGSVGLKTVDVKLRIDIYLSMYRHHIPKESNL